MSVWDSGCLPTQLNPSRSCPPPPLPGAQGDPSSFPGSWHLFTVTGAEIALGSVQAGGWWRRGGRAGIPTLTPDPDRHRTTPAGPSSLFLLPTHKEISHHPLGLSADAGVPLARREARKPWWGPSRPVTPLRFRDFGDNRVSGAKNKMFLDVFSVF